MCIAFPQLLARAFLPSGTALYRIWSHESESRSSLCSHYYAKHHLTISKCFFSHCLQDIPSFLSSPWRRTRCLVRHVSEAESFMTSLWSIRAMNRPRIQNQRILTSAGSKPWNKSGGVGGRSSRPWDKGAGTSLQKFFSSLSGLSLV